MKMEQSVPKRRHINFRRRGITQKKAYKILPNLQITFYIFTAPNTTGSNHCIILLAPDDGHSGAPKHVEQAIRSAIKTSVASSWQFISTY